MSAFLFRGKIEPLNTLRIDEAAETVLVTETPRFAKVIFTVKPSAVSVLSAASAIQEVKIAPKGKCTHLKYLDGRNSIQPAHF